MSSPISSPIAPPLLPVFHYDSREPVTWNLSSRLKILLAILLVCIALFNFTIFRVVSILSRRKLSSITPRPKPSIRHPTHLLIVLGSGGHTAEMLNMLQSLPQLANQYTHRTYIVSSGDALSSLKAKEFEEQLAAKSGNLHENHKRHYSIVSVRRARRVHQSILTAPWSASLCLCDCLTVLRGRHPDQQNQSGENTAPGYPDLILTNGPGTGVCVVLSALILLFCGIYGSWGGRNRAAKKAEIPWPHSGHMRTIFIESWARVKTLSLSGKILLPIVDRFLVQWPALEGRGGQAEYVGALVD